jgi:hypothetical protein
MSSTFSPRTGFAMKLYYATGNMNTPTWNEVGSVGDVNISSLSRGMAELKRRGSYYTKNLPSLFESITVEFTIPFGVSQTAYDQIRADFFSGTARLWAVMSGDITVSGVQGLVLPALVTQFPWDQPLEDVSNHNIQLSVAYLENSSGQELDPYWLVVGSSTTTTT